MLIGDLIEVYRNEEKDLVEPYFTSDLMLINYLNEALVEFAKTTMSFYDIESELTNIYVPAGFSALPFDTRILEIKHAFIKETNEQLSIISANSVTLPKNCLLVNTDARQMSLTKIYDKPVTLLLRIIRKPLKWLTCNDISLEIPDIDNEDYRTLLYYIKYLAFSVSDSELFDPNKAANNLALFEQKCQAVKELNLRRRAATQPIRMESLWSV